MKPEQKAAGVGVVTLVLGGALLAAPAACAKALHFPEGHETGLRAIGASDLALVPGLLKGRPRWPWMAARMTFNVAVGAWSARVGREDGGAIPWVVTAAMAGLTFADSTVVRGLRASE